MPRDLPIGNGSLLVNFDQTYQIRDLYWPHVGQENHTLGHTFRVGVWAEGQFRWLGDPRLGAQPPLQPETLLTAYGFATRASHSPWSSPTRSTSTSLFLSAAAV